jgi:dihydrodipicolinate synthase/N-acetylneuraminate lyase
MGPRWFGWGIDKTPEIVQNYVQDIAESVKIPIFFFMTGAYAGIKYTREMLVKFFDIENVIGIKDTTWETQPFEENLRALHALSKRPLVLTGNDTLLFYNFLAGARFAHSFPGADHRYVRCCEKWGFV